MKYYDEVKIVPAFNVECDYKYYRSKYATFILPLEKQKPNKNKNPPKK